MYFYVFQYQKCVVTKLKVCSKQENIKSGKCIMYL